MNESIPVACGRSSSSTPPSSSASGSVLRSGKRSIRHAQYVAFVTMMLVFLLQWPTLVTLAMFPVLAAMHMARALRDEKDSERAPGAAWRQYAAPTPRLLPSIRRLVSTVPGPA